MNGGSSEDDTARDGAFSYAGEWHAFSHGVYLGLVTRPWRRPPEPDAEDVAKERHYYRGGYVVGTLLQVCILAFFGVSAYTGMTQSGVVSAL